MLEKSASITKKLRLPLFSYLGHVIIPSTMSFLQSLEDINVQLNTNLITSYNPSITPSTSWSGGFIIYVLFLYFLPKDGEMIGEIIATLSRSDGLNINLVTINN